MAERYFAVSYKNRRGYTVLGNEATTIDGVWASQKCWFMTGGEVTIEDDKGNRKTFRKE
ncbi:MAG: hypothetical protein LUE14_01480 [Clostridiales bacterium]|nr:hypothetical protein [Clostridiales bacterium]